MGDSRDRELSELAEAARRDDGDALERLCGELQQLVRGFFWNRFSDPEVVDELTQETYLRMLKSFRHLRDASRIRAFVAKVAFHVSQDHLRQKYRSREESLEPLLDGGSVAEPAAPDGERVVSDVALESVLAELPARARQVLQLKAEGYKYEEIAARLELSVSGVKMQVKRSLEKLRSSVFV